MDSKEAKRIEELDKRHVWHPFTPMLEYEGMPQIVVESGKGSWITDVHGRRYLDGTASLWVNVHGHCRKEIDDAVAAQLGRIAHSTLLGLGNVPSALLAEKLSGIAPGRMRKVFYSDNGSTAAEVALKMAFQFWKRRPARGRKKRELFFRFTNAYHGDTIGSVSVGGIDLFHAAFEPLTFRTVSVRAPYCYRCPFGKKDGQCGKECFGELDRAFGKWGDRCAAVIIEPVVQGAAGIVIQPSGYLKHLEGLARKHGVLLIADEVATGFGRTGRMFACEHEGVEPDLMAVAKGITGGYLPLAATLATDEVYEGFLDSNPAEGTFFHGHTYTGNPLACAAAIASLEIFEKEKTIEMLQHRINRLARLLEKFRELECVGEARQIGLMAGIELVADRESRKPFPREARVGFKAAMEARKLGVIVRPLGDVLVLMPPLSISNTDLELLADVSYRAIETACRKVMKAGSKAQRSPP